jgi:hypothetical protein
MAENTEQRLARVNNTVTSSVSVFNRLMIDSFSIIKDDLVTLQKRIVLEVLRRVVLRTPVDTGRARGNWQIEVGSIPKGETGKLAKGEDAEAASIGSAQGGQVIADGLAKLKQLGFSEVVWIANNLEYVVFLEDGSSGQAEAGMLEITLLEVSETFR